MARSISNESCLQLLFDLQCIGDLLAGRGAAVELSPDAMSGPVLGGVADLASAVVASDALASSIAAVKERIDPFDLHVRQPFLDQCRARCVARSALLLGCFTHLRAAALPAAAGAAPDQHGVLLPLAPVASRFALLPVAPRPSVPAPPLPEVLLSQSVFAVFREGAADSAYSLFASALAV